MSFGGTPPGPALPPWIRERKLRLGALHSVRTELAAGGLATVCEEARCPNRSECFSRGTATFLINGTVCTRSCRYCAVAHGRPAPLDPGEPQRVAETAERMGLEHVVVTSVDRDDLPDGGAGAFVRTIEALRALPRPPTVEVLTPDFRGRIAEVDRILAARPEVYNHNVETVPRLYRSVRPAGRYRWALEVLERVATRGGGSIPKSGLMVGLGETEEEVLAVFRDLANVGCRVVTVGQYLRPTTRQVPVARYWPPEAFAELKRRGRELGLEVIAGPFVRSSYRAAEAYRALRD